jgi:hypothetical protein
MDGVPGPNYWQNRADYKIDAVFHPDTRIIVGREVITYYNNSPDSMRRMFFQLYQDLYKKGVARDWDLGPVDLHEGVKLKSVEIDGIKYTRWKRNSTILQIRLKKKFAPGSKHEIKISWELIIPGTRTVRMGTYNKTNFMVAYWFPKVVVYDDVAGYNDIPYTGSCEFYNEFGNYDVSIKVPAEYSLWATAPTTNLEELYKKNYLKRLDRARKTDEVIHIITKEDRAAGNILKKADSLVWKFHSEQTPDFAFAASKTYLWDATSVESGGRRVLINAVYKPGSLDFDTVADAAHKAIDYYTNISPKIPYPYPQLTAFNGRGGMEYPGMVNDGDSHAYNATLYLTAHEIGHSYFPFNAGLNEQLYAWMDEGMITYLPRKFVEKYNVDTAYDPISYMLSAYSRQAGSMKEIPLMVPSINAGYAYRYQAYARPSAAFYLLDDYLGTDTFNLALQEFMKRWEHKHPTPFDFFNTFNAVAGEDLGWFWKPWFFELGYADLALQAENDRVFTVKNKGGFPVPIRLTIYFKDGKTETMNLPMSIWRNGNRVFTVSFDKKTFKKLVLDTKRVPDVYPEDNVWGE